MIRFGSFGDLVLTTPTILNLRLAHPDSHVTFLTKERFLPLVNLFDGVDATIGLPEFKSPIDAARFSYFLAGLSFDMVLDLHATSRSWFFRQLITAGQKVTYDKRRRARVVLVRKKAVPAPPLHVIDQYNRAAGELGARAHAVRPIFTAHRVKGRASESALTGEGYICIAPEAAHATKEFPLDRFIELARSITGRWGVPVAWLVTRPVVVETLERAGYHREREIKLNLAWGGLAAILCDAALSLSNDSGVAHLASSVGVPSIAIFGPTHPALGFSPRGVMDRVIGTGLWCRPCSLHGKRPCFRNHQYCFSDITNERILQQVKECYESRPVHPALFIDRDGTLIEERGFLGDPDGVALTEGAASALKRAIERKFRLIVVSNQSGIARGLLSVEQVEAVNGRVRELLHREGVELTDMLYAPEYPGGIVPGLNQFSYRRKPSPGMIEEAILRHRIDPRRSFAIGDKLDDVNLGRLSGATPLLVRTGYGRKSEERLTATPDPYYAQVLVYDTLAGAIQGILRSDK